MWLTNHTVVLWCDCQLIFLKAVFVTCLSNVVGKAAWWSFLCLQWKVRHIVASSIHELAVILGEDLATEDLVPVFSGFMKDLDEVRIGALKHLADFLKVLYRPCGVPPSNCVTSPFPIFVRYWLLVRLYAVELLWGISVSCIMLLWGPFVSCVVILWGPFVSCVVLLWVPFVSCVVLLWGPFVSCVVLLWGPFVSCAYLHSCQKFKFIAYFLLSCWMDSDRPCSPFWGTAAVTVQYAISKVSTVSGEPFCWSLNCSFTEGLSVLETDIIMYGDHSIDIRT